eukprot:1159580-Pelagomonas_calceolata.AAC.3
MSPPLAHRDANRHAYLPGILHGAHHSFTGDQAQKLVSTRTAYDRKRKGKLRRSEAQGRRIPGVGGGR